MREIKFRAWSVAGKAWIAGFNMVNYHSYFNKGLEPSISRYSTQWADGEYVLSQFTGLKDKNGVDIYEGDIVKLDTWAQRQQISFIEGAFCLANADGSFAGDIHYCQHAERKQAKIVGNIYETPELLK